MTDGEDLRARIEDLRLKLRQVHGIRGRDLGQAVRRSKLFLPRRIRKEALRLAEAEPLLGNPKLERTIDFAALHAAHRVVADHLNSVDVADLRRGRLLGIAGAMAVNVILVVVLFIVWLRWTGQL